MIWLDCPWCGPRDLHEFSYGSEAHIQRPALSAKLSDAEWADYLFMRQNHRGLMYERWVHTHGCRRWFNAIRDTVSDKVHITYPMQAKPPIITQSAAPLSAESEGRPELRVLPLTN